MIHFTDMTGLASSAVAMVAALFMLPGVARLPKPYPTMLAGMAVLVALIPFGGLQLAAYVRGIIGDLSITSLILLVISILRPLFCWRRADMTPILVLPVLIALAAVVLYPMALGLGLLDPYRWGYGNPWFMGMLLVLALAACFRQFHTVAFCIALAVFAWSVGWYESTNLWDYLLDPWVSVYMTGALMKHVLRRTLERGRSAGA